MTEQPIRVISQTTCRLCDDPFDTPLSRLMKLLVSGFSVVLLIGVGCIMIYLSIQESNMFGALCSLVPLGVGGLMFRFAGGTNGMTPKSLCADHVRRIEELMSPPISNDR